MRKILEGIDLILGGAAQLMLALSCGLFAFVLFSNAANIFWRFVSGTAINWVFPWSGVIFCWIVFCGFFAYYRRNQDVVVDVVLRSVSPAVQKLMVLAGLVIVAALAALIASTGYRVILSQADLLQMVNIPRYALAIPLFLSAGLIALESLMRVGFIVCSIRPAVTPIVPAEVEGNDRLPAEAAR